MATDYDIVSRLRLIALDEAVQARWRREHQMALLWSWCKRMRWPAAGVVVVGAALYELFFW